MRNEKTMNIFNNVDVIVDGRFVNDLKDLTLDFRGSSNQKIIRVMKDDAHTTFFVKGDQIPQFTEE